MEADKYKYNKQGAAIGAKNVFLLANTIHTNDTPPNRPWVQRNPFVCSEEFRTNLSFDCQPLDFVKWNERLECYDMVNEPSQVGDGSKEGRNKKRKISSYVMDDAILQSMVMFFLLARVKYGWTHKKMLSQLSIWPKDAETTLPNRWESSIQKWKNNRKLGNKTLSSAQQYRTASNLYSIEGYCRELRKGEKGNIFGKLHFLIEQSCVQWAMAEKEKDHRLSKLSALVVKLLFQYPRRQVMSVATIMSELLKQEGQKEDPKRFAKNVCKLVKSRDWLQEQLNNRDSRECARAFHESLSKDMRYIPDEFGQYY